MTRPAVPIDKEMPVEFFEGPWDGAAVTMHMPPPARLSVGNVAPDRQPGQSPPRLELANLRGPHRYDRKLLSVGYVYHYHGRAGADASEGRPLHL